LTTPTSDSESTQGKKAAASKEFCYIHPERRAVATCGVCKRGVCRLCRVSLNGKSFCRADEALLRGRVDAPSAKVSRRRHSITLAAVLSFFNGLAGTVVGFLLLIIGLLGPQAKASYSLTPALQPFFTYFADVLNFPSGQAIDVGLIAFVGGLLDIFAAYLLMRRSRIGGIIAVATSIFGGFLIGSYLVILALAGAFVYVHILTAAVKVALIAVGWKYLDER
jgi:hypothetical protein